MDEYISMNDDTGFITESDIDNLCKIVDLHALMIQESYDENLETVESYIESVISNYFNDIKTVQESDSEEVFIDPRVVKAAKTYKHNKENPSSTVFIDPTAVNAMAYRRNSKEYTKNLLTPAIKEIMKNPNIKHVKLSDIDPYKKLHDAEGHVNIANREKKELEEIKNHKNKDDPKFADLNKFMYDKMSDDHDERLKKIASVKPGKFNPGKKYRMEGVEMNDEFIMFNNEADSYQESYESDESVTLEDVESYLESLSTDIDDAVALRDDMIQEGYEYEDLTLEDVETYIEFTIDEYNDIVDTVNDIVQEADEVNVNNRVADYKESYTLDNPFEGVVELDMEEPLTAYEFFDESYEPDDEPFVPYTDEGIYIEADGPEKHDLTLGGAIVIGAGLGAAVGTGINIINMLITEHKYGRFPHDMKRVYDIIQKADFKASANKRILKKALKAVSKDLRWMFKGIGGHWKLTVNEATELKKLRKHVDDLYTRGWMLTRNEELSQKRRVPERIAEFVEQGNKVLKILSKSVYKNPADDVTTEYMV